MPTDIAQLIAHTLPACGESPAVLTLEAHTRATSSKSTTPQSDPTWSFPSEVAAFLPRGRKQIWRGNRRERIHGILRRVGTDCFRLLRCRRRCHRPHRHNLWHRESLCPRLAWVGCELLRMHFLRRLECRSVRLGNLGTLLPPRRLLLGNKGTLFPLLKVPVCKSLTDRETSTR